MNIVEIFCCGIGATKNSLSKTQAFEMPALTSAAAEIVEIIKSIHLEALLISETE